MALNTFGWTPAEVTQDSAGNVVAGVTLTVFTDVTKSTQVTGLFDKDGVTPIPSGVVVSDNKGRFGFKASDAYNRLYVYDGSTADPWPITAYEAGDGTSALTRSALGQSFARVYTPQAYGAKADGTTNDSAAIQSAIDAAAAVGGVVHFPSGTYACNGLALRSKVTLRGAPGSVLLKNGGVAGVSLITATGTLGAATTLTDTAKGSKTVTVASASGLAAGDYVLLRDATYAYSTFGRNQEIARIASISGTTVTLAEYTLGAYAAASTAELLKLTPVADATIEGLTLTLPAGQPGGGVEVKLSVNVHVTRCDISGFSDNPAVSFVQSARCRASLNRIHDGVNVDLSGQGYGLQVADSSHHCILGPGNVIENVRENMFTNNARVSSFISNTVTGTWGTAINTHGSGCKNIVISGNVVSGSLGYGIAVGHGTDNIADESVVISSNVVASCAGGGIITNSGSTATPNRSKNIVISGNQVRDVGLSATGNAAIWVINSDHAIVTGNAIDCSGVTNTVHGIVLKKAEYGATVANNTIRNIVGRGIRVTDVTTEPVLVQGNRMFGVGSFQIMVDSTSTATIPAVFISNFGSVNSTSLLGTEVLLGNKFGTAWSAKAVTGSRGGNAALASLLTTLAGAGLITDSTTA